MKWLERALYRVGAIVLLAVAILFGAGALVAGDVVGASVALVLIAAAAWLWYEPGRFQRQVARLRERAYLRDHRW